MDLPLSDRRRMAFEEFDTTKLLKHAAQQAAERGYKDFPIVDVDSHHYESESLNEILDYMDDPVLQQVDGRDGHRRRGDVPDADADARPASAGRDRSGDGARL